MAMMTAMPSFADEPLPYPATVGTDQTDLKTMANGDYKYAKNYADENNDTYHGFVRAYYTFRRKAYLDADCPDGYRSTQNVFTERTYTGNTLFVPNANKWNPKSNNRVANALSEVFDEKEQRITSIGFDWLRRYVVLRYEWRNVSFDTTHKLSNGTKTGQDYDSGVVKKAQTWMKDSIVICVWNGNMPTSEPLPEVTLADYGYPIENDTTNVDYTVTYGTAGSSSSMGN